MKQPVISLQPVVPQKHQQGIVIGQFEQVECPDAVVFNGAVSDREINLLILTSATSGAICFKGGVSLLHRSIA